MEEESELDKLQESIPLTCFLSFYPPLRAKFCFINPDNPSPKLIEISDGLLYTLYRQNSEFKHV
jgi:hypothetical protein